MSRVKSDFKNKYIILDGAMGTMLQKSNITLPKVPEVINITSPEVVIDIHKKYISAGANIIYTNTFGANKYKVSECEYSSEELVSAGVKNALKAAKGTDTLVALSVGPIGELLEPNGNLKFEDAYDMFKTMVMAGYKAGADLVVVETMTDLLEAKAAVLAVKENTPLPVFCTMTFEAGGRTFTGVTPACAAVTLEGLGVDAVGINCSLGPDEILPIAKEMSLWTTLPIIVKANAGLPNLNSDSYDISAEDFLDFIKDYLELGINIIGGCCGTTPEYIKLIADFLKGKTPVERNTKPKSVLCSAGKVITIDKVSIVGERINPTGKKLFKKALADKNISYILKQGIDQVNAGADILDVNVGLPEIDEKEMMVTVIKELQSITDTPLQIDSSNADVIEAGLRCYNGKAIVNSVNGEQKVLDTILPIVKKYGASVIGLTLDENGIPNRAEDRFEVAKKIVTACKSYGIDEKDIYIDCLTLTASVQQKEVIETLKAMTMVKEALGVKTVLGVSNISFGLPNRELINSSFLTLALSHGLDLPIINPNIRSMTDAIDAFNVLYNKDLGAVKYIKKQSETTAENKPKATAQDDNITLEYAVQKGIKDYAKECTKALLENTDPLEIINNILIPSLDKVGEEFEKGKIFLPQLIQSATAAQAAFEQIKLSFDKASGVSKGKIILATVKGDVHDIGKNIVKVILENYGYEVIDLGKDVPIETVVSMTKSTGAKLVGLSALMTTTVVSMAQTIKALKDNNVDCKIMVGGAVLTKDYAAKIGADFYAKDAKQSADIAKEVLG